MSIRRLVETMKTRILVVDDEPVVRHVLERALSGEHEIRLLASSEKVEAVLKPFRPDLMILDVHMPGENGWELCRRLRTAKQYDAIPVIFLSALSDEVSVRKGFACGGDFYLPKPFNIPELLRVVDIFLGRKHHHPDEPFSI